MVDLMYIPHHDVMCCKFVYKFCRWREESKSLAQKFEHTITDLKTELSRYKIRSDDLTKQLTHLKRAKDDLGKQLSNATSSNSNLKHKLNEAEAQAETARSQLAQHLSREKQLLQERRELNKSLDKAKMHITRNAR